jgi:uncharacterized Zn-binding protein involved in type VI secretion
MPSPILDQGAVITCAHGGAAPVTEVNSRVLVGGQPVLTLPAASIISGCPLPVAHGTTPCRTGEFLTGATRVTAMGQALVLADSLSVTAPSATPLLVAGAQQRVTAI